MGWFGKSKSWVEEVRVKGISDEHRDLLIKALLLARAIGHMDILGSAEGINVESLDLLIEALFLARAIGHMDGLGSAEGINVETLDLLIKVGKILLLFSPGTDNVVRIVSACEFILKFAASDDGCPETAKNRFEKTKSWVEMAKTGFEVSKSWAAEKIRASGIIYEHRVLVMKGGGALLLAAAMGYYGGFIFRGGSSKDDEKFRKAPGRPTSS